jgi:ABC-type branched-subunit amino acid transport system substrate-binding protein
MREMGMHHAYLACDRCAHRDFVAIAGDNAEGVVCGYPWNPKSKDPRFLRFRAAYRERFGQEPETYASHAYDGMNMVIWAIQAAGLNRAKIRDVLAYMPEAWPGVTGDIQLSACLDDVGDVYLAKFEKGEWNYYSRADLGIPKGYIPPRDRVSRPDEKTAMMK